MQRVTITSTRYDALYLTFSLSLIWIGHNAMCYHNFNVLPRALTYIFSQFSILWSYLQHVTTRYRQVYKKLYTNTFLKTMMLLRGNAFQKVQNQANLKENIR